MSHISPDKTTTLLHNENLVYQSYIFCEKFFVTEVYVDHKVVGTKPPNKELIFGSEDDVKNYLRPKILSNKGALFILDICLNSFVFLNFSNFYLAVKKDAGCFSTCDEYNSFLNPGNKCFISCPKKEYFPPRENCKQVSNENIEHFHFLQKIARMKPQKISRVDADQVIRISIRL